MMNIGGSKKLHGTGSKLEESKRKLRNRVRKLIFDQKSFGIWISYFRPLI